MKKPLNILLLEDCIEDADLIQHLLVKKIVNCKCRVAGDKKTYLQALKQFCPDIILSDHSLPQFNSVEALVIARQEFPGIPFIMVTGTVSEEFAADIIRSGADDYVLKDRLFRLPSAINTVLQLRKIEKEKLEVAEKLRRSEQNYRTIMERVSDGFVALDKHWFYTYVNKEAGAIMQRKPQELTGKHIWTEFPQDIDGRFYNAYLKAMKGQQYVHIEEYNHTVDKWLENHIYPSPDGLSIFFRDITERKETEKAMIENEEKYRTIFYKSPLPKWIYDPASLYFLDVNEAAIRHYGYSQEEFLNMTIKEIRPKEDIALLLDDLRNTPETDIRHGNWRHITRDGEIIIVETTAHSVNYNGRTTRLVVANDITERIKAEQKIIQSESNLRTIFENTSEWFLLMDRDAVVLAFNKKAGNRSLFCKDKEIQIGQSIYDFIEEPQKVFFYGIIEKVLKGEGIHFESDYDSGTGATAWIEFSVTPVIEADQVKGICVTGRDITEKKITEHEREFDRNNLKALINNIRDPMWSVDRSFKLITSNNAFDNRAALISGQAVTKKNGVQGDEVSKKQLNRLRKYYERALSGESFTETDYTDFPEDFWSENSFYPIYNGTDVVGAACFSHDITWRKRAEKEITDYKNALDQSSIVSITDQNGVIKHVNNNFCKISGYLSAELVGQDHRIINSRFHDGPYIKNLWATITKGKIWRGELCNQAKDGTLYWVDATIIPFLNSKGTPVHYLAITNNITEKKLMEQKIIAQKIQEQKKIARAIIKAQEKERNYLGLELHDNINQILASSKLYLEIAGNKHEEVKELNKYPMELINSSIEEIRLLCSNLVTPLKNIDLEELVQKLLTKLEQNTNVKTDFVFNRPDDRLPDDLKLNIYRILQEQLNNIAKHAFAQKVTVSIRTANGVITVVVADDGKGFDVNKKRKGIGISNMINRIETFNGEVIIESTPGKGCRITISAPY
jgi:PAS domain S-box-containing protein